ncbi:MAG: glycoside hydrolase family 127 protein, partial [Bacteroidota bacterium]|nr:glycoside hydrolase family 127 protein [Bacteroidota bacterium]
LEQIAFNALPTQITEDFLARQYFQQANQVMVTRQTRNFDQNHGGTDVCYGLLTGYPCCTSNMHQGWPKFTQNLWYATPDNGLAALVYAPSEVKAFVANGTEVTFKEETLYPFDETVRFTFTTAEKKKSVSFPFHLRIPGWCKKAVVKINGTTYQEAAGNTIVKIHRAWKSGDVVELQLPMHIFKNTWYENSVSVERGPLVYALKMEEEWRKMNNEKDPIEYGEIYYEITPKSPWNYGLIQVPADKMETAFAVTKRGQVSDYPWHPDRAPIAITTTARRIPSWGLYNGMAGPIPFSITNGLETEHETEQIVLIPYGCTHLRISQFPVIRR